MPRLILAVPEARKIGTEHAADNNLDHRSSLSDDMVTDLTRPIKRIPEKFSFRIQAVALVPRAATGTAAFTVCA
jgi:hypothetical protein